MEQIICKSGEGKLKNPHCPSILIPNDGYDANPEWHDFEANNPPLPTFLPNGSEFLEDGCFEGEVVWQFNRNDGSPKGKWTDIREEITYYRDIPTRQIFRIHLPDKKTFVAEGKEAIELVSNYIKASEDNNVQVEEKTVDKNGYRASDLIELLRSIRRATEPKKETNDLNALDYLYSEIELIATKLEQNPTNREWAIKASEHIIYDMYESGIIEEGKIDTIIAAKSNVWGKEIIQSYLDYNTDNPRQFLYTENEPVSELEEVFRNFIRKEHLTSKWDAFSEDYPGFKKIVDSSRIPVNCYHAQCPKCGEGVDVIPSEGTFIEANNSILYTEDEVREIVARYNLQNRFSFNDWWQTSDLNKSNKIV